MDDNDNLYIELDNGESAEGWYDSSDDTFSLDGMSGWFYYGHGQACGRHPLATEKCHPRPGGSHAPAVL